MVSKGKARRPALFARSAGGTLKIQEELLYTLALDIKILRLTCHNSYAKLNLFIDEAQRAWVNTRYQIACDSCRGESFIRWLRGLIKESYEAKLWVPSGFIKRLRQLERGELVLKCRCGRICAIPLHSDLPIEFKECARFMGWKWNVIPTWDGNYEDLSEGSPEGDKEVSQLVKAVVSAWRERPRSDETQEFDLRIWIAKYVNESECGWRVS